MSDMVNGMQKYYLYTKKKAWKIIYCRLFLGFRGIFHFFLICGLFALLMEKNIDYMGAGVLLTLMALIIVVPFILHAVFICLFRLGYALFYNGKVEIATKLKTCSLNNGVSVTPTIVGHHLKYSTNPVYYVVKLSFEENGKKQKVCLYTDSLDYFNPVLQNVQLVKKEK